MTKIAKCLNRLKLREGLLEAGATGGYALNPLKSGLSHLELRPFYRSQQIEDDDTIDEDVKVQMMVAQPIQF